MATRAWEIEKTLRNIKKLRTILKRQDELLYDLSKALTYELRKEQ